jgi:DNA-binding PadR family transcriptional regulator
LALEPFPGGDRLATDLTLTENEGSLLGVIVRLEPLTAHSLIKTYRDSPVNKINKSKGAVYPQVKRLKARGFLTTEGKPEMIRTTELGRNALRACIKSLSHDHTFLPDPIRYRMLLLDLLTRDEQIEWAIELKRLLAEKTEELRVYNENHRMPFGDIVQNMAIAGLELKMRYVDDLLLKIVRSGASS